MSDDNILINPEELRKKKQREAEAKAAEENAIALPTKQDSELAKNLGSKIRINYEQGGRFSIPYNLYFSDYKVKHITDVTLSRPEDMLSTLIHSLNEMCESEINKVEDMTPDEFLDTMISLKKGFCPDDAKEHKHFWMCDCQADVPEKQRKFNEEILNLMEIKYRSIEQTDEEMKKYYKSVYPSISKEDLEKIKVQEPIIMESEGSKYTLRFTRMKDILKGYKMSEDELNPEMRRIRNSSFMPDGANGLADINMIRQEELEKLEREKGKKALMYTKAMCLISKDGHELNDVEKIHEFNNMDRKFMTSLSAFLDKAQVGVYDERKMKCKYCDSPPERRWLQQQFNPIEFIPVDDNTGASTKGKLQKSPTVNIYFGVKA